MTPLHETLPDIETNGFTVCRHVFDFTETAALGDSLARALAADASEAVRRSESGHAFAARNLPDIWPAVHDIWRKAPLLEAIGAVLGPLFGLVRGLFFDKPPDNTWSLPWHKDMTVAVRDNRRLAGDFSKPTTKVGIPHVEAPTAVLRQMLTARIHLDRADDDNGALMVIPGSHHTGKALPTEHDGAVTIRAEPGDVLLIRPLVAHCSASSRAGVSRHRRVIHLEFAASKHLPHGLEWRWFLPACTTVN